jgi:hypothetical protein
VLPFVPFQLAFKLAQFGWVSSVAIGIWFASLRLHRPAEPPWLAAARIGAAALLRPGEVCWSRSMLPAGHGEIRKSRIGSAAHGIEAWF